MKSQPEKLYEKTGMYINWDQLKDLPEIDTLIDIGIGTRGTPELYEIFPDKKLILIDPIKEAKKYIDEQLKNKNFKFFNVALGEKDEIRTMNIEPRPGRSTFEKVTPINYEGEVVEKRKIEIKMLDNIIANEKNLGRIGIKIDSEGYELKIINGATKTLKQTSFVIAEVRHNQDSYVDGYKLKDFVLAMNRNDFILTTIFTAKPLIADLCFEPVSKLIQ